MFRSGSLDISYKKARFLIMMISKILVLGIKDDPLNSNKIEKKAKELKEILLDDKKCHQLFKKAVEVFKMSGIDINKSRYKSESDTELIIDYFTKNNKVKFS